MTPLDPELRRLLIEELQKHLDALSRHDLDSKTQRLVLHSVKGAAGLVGETDLSDAFSRLERLDNPAHSTRLARTILQQALANLNANRQAYRDPWPNPPDDLWIHGNWKCKDKLYYSDMMDRLREWDLSLSSDPHDGLKDALRHLHTLKGAAAAVGDEVMAWFCHGLESHLSPCQNPEQAQSLVDQMERWRPVLAGLLTDPTATLDLLRANSPGSVPHTPLPSTVAFDPSAHPWLQVPTQTLDLVLERLRRIHRSAREMEGQTDFARNTARQLRDAKQRLSESQRLIGPPRPWGAPLAALHHIENASEILTLAACQLDSLASTTRRGTRSILQSTTSSHNELRAVRQATVAVVFDRVAEAVQTIAERSFKKVQVEQVGTNTPIDRHVANSLVDPLLQLARNAVVHGIESPDVRAAVGKPPFGRIRLSAEIRGAHLILRVADDGAGIDLQAVRAKATSAGRLLADASPPPSDEALLNLLFLPGMSTHPNVDLLAGRGIGLDIALHTIRRLGGTVRLRHRKGHGLTAIVDIPVVERGHALVLWVRSAQDRFALTARHLLQTHLANPHHPAPSLASLMDPQHLGLPGKFVIEVGKSIDDAIRLTVDEIEGFEYAPVRPVPPLVALAGPYVGVVVHTDGHPSLLVDALLVAERTWKTPYQRYSTFPPVERKERKIK